MKPGIYRHYKGSLYQVFGVGRHEETYEVCVIYQHLSGDFSIWLRPMDVFNETVVYEGQQVPRFQFVAESMTVPATVL